MKWMGAGAVLVGVGLPACRRVEKYLVPYNEGPEWSVPGVETAYATCLTMGGSALPCWPPVMKGVPSSCFPPCNIREGPGLAGHGPGFHSGPLRPRPQQAYPL